MNEVDTLIRGAACAKLLPMGNWIFCWFRTRKDAIIAFAEKDTGAIYIGFWNLNDGAWVEPS